MCRCHKTQLSYFKAIGLLVLYGICLTVLFVFDSRNNRILIKQKCTLTQMTHGTICLSDKQVVFTLGRTDLSKVKSMRIIAVKSILFCQPWCWTHFVSQTYCTTTFKHLVSAMYYIEKYKNTNRYTTWREKLEYCWFGLKQRLITHSHECWPSG